MGASEKHEATYHTGEPVDPWLPRRTPMESLAEWGAPPPPDEVPDRMHYGSPGAPPWASQVEQDLAVQHGWPTPGEKRKGLPAWAWVSIVLGVVLLVCGSTAAVSIWGESGPAPAVRVPAAAPVTTSGTCEKRIVGEYGLVATVRATNATDKPQTGALWVRWPVTGEAAQEFTKRATLAPGETVELPVNQAVTAERWFHTGACSYGWTPS